MLDEFFQQYEFGAFSALDVTANLLVALVLALVTSFVYRRTHSGYSYSRSFNVTLIAVTMTITMIMMVIGNYWVLSLGLIGALSIIRFRSAIKDPKDIAYLFLCIAIGLACSTGNYMISVIGAAIINATLYVLHVIRFGGSPDSGYCLTLTVDETQRGDKKLLDAIQNAGVDGQFRSYARLGDGIGEFVYTIDLNETPEQTLIDRLNADVSGLRSLSLIAPETNLEL